MPDVGKEFLEQMALTDALKEIGAPAVPHLLAALRQPELQAEASLILGDIGAAAVPGLVGLLGDDRLGPRAAVELHKIGPPAIPALTRALSDPQAGPLAAVVLGEIGPAAIDELEQCARRADPATTGRAARALAMIGPLARESLQRLAATAGAAAEQVHAAVAELADDSRSTSLDLARLPMEARLEAADRLPADVIALFREIYPEHAGYHYRVAKCHWPTPRCDDEAQAIDITNQWAFGLRIILSPDQWLWSIDVGWTYRNFMPRMYAWGGFQLAWRSFLLSLPVQWLIGIWPTWTDYWWGLLTALPVIFAIGSVVYWMAHYGLIGRRLRAKAALIEFFLRRRLTSSVVFRAEMRHRLQRDGVAQALESWAEELRAGWDDAAWTPPPEFAQCPRLRPFGAPPHCLRPWEISDDQRRALEADLRGFVGDAVELCEAQPSCHAEIVEAANYYRLALASPPYRRSYHVGIFLDAAADRGLVLKLIGFELLVQARRIGLTYVAAGQRSLDKAKAILTPLLQPFEKPPEIRWQTWLATSVSGLSWRVIVYELDIDPDEADPWSKEELACRFAEKAAEGKCTWSVFVIQQGRKRIIEQSIVLGISPKSPPDE